MFATPIMWPVENLGGSTMIATDVTGEHYRYEPLEREDWIAYRRSIGRPEWSIEAGITFYDGVARGEADVVSDDYRQLTGRLPLSIRQLIELYRDEMLLTLTGAE